MSAPRPADLTDAASEPAVSLERQGDAPSRLATSTALPLEPHTEAEEATHSLRFRHVEGWTLYSCECGQFDDDAGSDEEARRVYEAHAEHIRAAIAAPVAQGGEGR